ncbi:MAG: bacillithiol biosynthesis cysteine-adding enzyme BshC [Ignavibacteriales bacterium]|nr:MAG: bacillithiol biosynthesis cysteine-adding enzyme BshC [Ignavibacteriales bacterium]
MFINFSDIPAHQNLFLDYLDEFENVERFYGKNFRATEQYLPFFQQLSKKNRPNRLMISEILKAQYQNQKYSKHTEQNIHALASEKTIAVLTGQQLGIFGGPLYTIYKSITAIKLCNHLKENYDGFNFVPVFWLEGDDHDYDEVRNLSILNNENQILNLKYDDGQLDEVNRGSIGGLKFNQNIENVINELAGSLRETEFKAPLLDLIKSIYQPDRTFLETFRELMIRLFDEYGLIVFNPLDTAVRKLLTPVFSKEITEFGEHTGDIVERSAELEEVYHAQVKVKPINLFYIEEKERLSIEPTETGEYRLKGKRKKFTKDELLTQLESSPEKFSPNVLLRPICQDYLFPTAFYIGGPGEISYFAQVSPLYKIYNIDEPFIYPRSSATIAEKGVQTILEKNGLTYTDIFSEEEELIQKILAASSEINLETLFLNSQEEINSTLNQISDKLFFIDKTLVDLTSKSKQRIEETINYLKTKAVESEKRKYDSTIRQISKVRNVLYPNNNLQERELNWIYFANKYGMDIFKWIYNELAINKFEHQILEL